ncbi:ABC transporter ATP-binding protein/permease [Pseudothauera nasutitermitis]|uniref:ABC transporter ATP-binding protein/permease n=2 Tax=Pseudothauera nasutitermitis TaxID=2565930 RepID=A0A4S4B4E6_9RHOO|nr:ABC transporter ATP-binding protein/permease [Pseudothauera nasutitermitis]
MGGQAAVAAPPLPARPADVPPASRRARLGAAWRLARAYWVSEERWPARGLLALVVVLDLLIVYRYTRISYWQKDFYDALTNYDVDAFYLGLLELLIIAMIGIVLDASRTYTAQYLEIRWRNWMTDVFLQRWFSGRAYYRFERGNGADNPDQRIAEDLRLMASNTLELGLGLLSNLTTLASFAVIVWGLSGTLSLALGGTTLEVPGYIFWAAVLYALAGSWAMEKIGGRMVTIDYTQQQREADFRVLLVRVREYAEQIAFYRGEKAEEARLRDSFRAIRANWREIMTYTKRITIADSFYTEVGAIVPTLLVGPRYFAHQMTFGDYMQLGQAFMRVRVSLSWFIYKYKELALLRSVYRRLVEFERVLAHPPDARTLVRPEPDAAAIEARGLSLRLPDGRQLVDTLDWRIAPGERWLIRGHSGAGKSTLLRALAGLWPHGSGEIAMPAGREMFLPQQSYLPVGSLRACLCYPSDEQWFGIGECLAVLREVGLEELAGELDVHDNWAKRLSPGEQQRLAFARLLLHKPAWVFLDESTSSLDPRNESRLYELLIERLPGAAIVSVAHRTSLARFHTHALELGEGRAAVVAP